MQLKQQIKAIHKVLEDQKAENIVIIKTLKQSADMDVIIIASASSIKHAQGIANNVKIKAKHLGMTILGIEGAILGEWILIDLVDIVVHIMTNKSRDFYKLEDLWSVTN